MNIYELKILKHVMLTVKQVEYIEYCRRMNGTRFGTELRAVLDDYLDKCVYNKKE